MRETKRQVIAAEQEMRKLSDVYEVREQEARAAWSTARATGTTEALEAARLADDAAITARKAWERSLRLLQVAERDSAEDALAELHRAHKGASR